MKALILAAGLGQRLGPLTRQRPKALTKVLDRELILYVMDFLNDPAITARAVVTGFAADTLSTFVKKHAPRTEIFYNPQYEKGSITTLETALSFLDDDFLLLNVDHIYPARMLKTIMQGTNGITAMCDFDRNLVTDDMKVKLDDNRRLQRIMKTLTDYDGGYIGMTYCDRKNLDTYRRAVRETRETYGDGAPVEWVLGHLTANGHKVNICDVSGMGWLEVDTPDDLNKAEIKLSQQKDFLR